MAEPIAIPLDIPLHSQCRIERPLRVALKGDGSSEQGEDAIAQGLGDITVVAVDGLHHELESWVDDGAGFFRVEVSYQGGRAFDVRKQSGNGFSFTACGSSVFHGGLFGQDTLDEVRRGVSESSLGNSGWIRGSGRGGLGLGAQRLCRERRGALSAENMFAGILKPAIRAAGVERAGTFATEIHSLDVFKATTQAFQLPYLPSPWFGLFLSGIGYYKRLLWYVLNDSWVDISKENRVFLKVPKKNFPLR